MNMMEAPHSLTGVVCLLLAWAAHQPLVTLGEEVVAGAVFGPGFSLVCSPPAAAAATAAALRGLPPSGIGGVRSAAVLGGGSSSGAVGGGSSSGAVGGGSSSGAVGGGSSSGAVGGGSSSGAVGGGSSFGAVGGGSRSAAVGGGSRSAAVGGGSSSAAVGGGSSSAAVGGGSRSAAVGGGSRSAAVGGGSRSAAVGGGSRSAAVGGGSSSAAVGGGSSSAAVGGGSRSAAVGGGSRYAAVGGGSSSAAVGGGSRSSAVGGGSRSAAVGGGSSSAAVGGGSRSAAVGGGSRSAAVGGGSRSGAVGGGSSSAVVGGGSSSAVVGGGSSSAVVGGGSSSAVVGGGSSSAVVGGGSSSAVVGGGSSSAVVGGGSSSYSSLQRIISGITSSKCPNTNLTSFTFCTFVKMSKSRLRSPLFTYVGENWTVILDVTRMGVGLQVQEAAKDAGLRYYFEAKFPPDVWRHLCVQFDHLTCQAVCFVDDTSEPLSGDLEVTEGDEASRASDNNNLVVEDSGNTAWMTADELNSTTSSGRPGVGKDQEPQPVMTGKVCVGGGHLGTLEAEVARAAFWRTTLGLGVLSQASGCRGGRAMEDPYLAMGPQWLAAGNASLRLYRLDEVCHSVLWVVVVRPAGAYSRHVMVCQALGARLMTSEALTSDVMTLARGTNDSCVGSGGLVTWLLGGREGKGATTKVTAEDECPAQGIDGGISAACVRQLKCSLCHLPSTVMYNLYGHDGRLFDYTFYIDVVSGELIFRGLGGSEIVRVGSGWVLRSALHQMEWVLGEGAVPVGRQRWAAGGDKVLLALTTCRTAQFTCDTGQCVAMTSRCDDIVHCSDRSDETNCRVIERSSGYDPYYPPPPRPHEEKPMDLFYHVDVYSMDDMTTEGGKATMNVGMTLTWFDSRLKFLNLKPAVKNYFPCQVVWTPSVRAVSGHGEGAVLETTNYEKLCYAYADENTNRPLEDPFMSHQADGMTNAIYNYVGVVASVPCHFHLQMYPFDFQLCNISFMLMNAPWTRVFKKSQKEVRVPYLDSRRVLLEYELMDLTTEVGWFLQGTDNNTYFVLTFHLRRLYGYHVVNSFFPSLLMFFVAYSTLFFQLEDFENRIMVSLTAQLVLAALFTSTTQSSVKTPYLKLIDVWYASIITFCFVIVIIQTVINVILNSIRLPPLVLWAVGLRLPQLQGHKTLMTSLRTETNKIVQEGLSSRQQQQQQQQQQQLSGEEVAGRYNTVFGVLILLVVLTFVVSYSMMAMRLL